MDIKKAPLSYHDSEFLDSKQARPIRILSEYLNPERRLAEYQIKHTIVFFGSARIGRRKDDPMQHYYDTAEELAFQIASWSQEQTDPEKKVYICTGGGPGIMEAANKGANHAGEKTIGLNISLPFEQQPNPYVSPELNMEFHYFYTRKLWFLYHAKAIIAFPGGFGTLDELFETLTLIQTKKIEKPFLPVLLYDKEYWQNLINFDSLVKNGLIGEKDLELIQFFDSPQEAMDILKPAVTELIEKHTNKNF